MLFVCCGVLNFCIVDFKCIIVKVNRYKFELCYVLLLVCISYYKYIFLIYLYKI